jgi:hypothetical protein
VQIAKEAALVVNAALVVKIERIHRHRDPGTALR